MTIRDDHSAEYFPPRFVPGRFIPDCPAHEDDAEPRGGAIVWAVCAAVLGFVGAVWSIVRWVVG